MFLLTVSLPLTLIEYFASQTVFWSWMSTTVLTVTKTDAFVSANESNTTTIFGIQTYLTGQFKTFHELSIYGVSSALYRLDQEPSLHSYGIVLSFLLLFALTFSLIYMFFGFYSEYYYNENQEWLYYDVKKDVFPCLKNAFKRTGMKRALMAFIIAFLIMLILVYC